MCCHMVLPLSVLPLSSHDVGWINLHKKNPIFIHQNLIYSIKGEKVIK